MCIGSHWWLSEAIGGHRKTSVIISSHWWSSAVIGSYWWSSVVIGSYRWSSEAIGDHRLSSVVIGSHRWSSVVIGGHRKPSVIIERHLWSSAQQCKQLQTSRSSRNIEDTSKYSMCTKNHCEHPCYLCTSRNNLIIYNVTIYTTTNIKNIEEHRGYIQII